MSYRLRQAVQELLDAERGTIYKPHGGRVRFALAFPNAYRLGMSNLGYQLVYRLINDHPDAVCERTFLPSPEEEREHRNSGTPLFTWETQTPVGNCDVIAFSVSFEMDYLNVLKMLELSGLPLRAADRDESQPLVIMGGPAPWVNAEAVAPFVDAIIIGEAEGMTEMLIPLIRDYISAGKQRDKADLLRRLSQIQGVYVPALYEPAYGDNGTLAEMTPLDGAPMPVRRWVTRDLDKYNTSAPITTPNTEFSNMFMIEAVRGCGQGCRFCFVGYAYRPVRYTPQEHIAEEVAQRLIQVGEVERAGLIGSSLTDHKHIADITEMLAKDRRVTLASLRADKLDEPLACAIGHAGQKTVTIAPETGSQRLRYVTRKHVTDEDTVTAARRCAANGVQKIKLYYIVGLPCENQADRLAIATLSDAVARAGDFRKVTLTLHPFVPKPHTAYQWAGTLQVNEMQRRLREIGKAVRQINKRLDFTVDSVRGSFVQSVMATADRRIADVLLAAHHNGGNWKQAFRETGIDPEWYACRPRPYEEVLPWEHVNLGVKKEYLWREWQRALEYDRQTREHGFDPADAAPHSKGPAEPLLDYLAWR